MWNAELAEDSCTAYSVDEFEREGRIPYYFTSVLHSLWELMRILWYDGEGMSKKEKVGFPNVLHRFLTRYWELVRILWYHRG